jgi:hypothetical protein
MSSPEHKVEKKQTSTKNEGKRKRAASTEQKPKEQKVESQHKNPIKTFEKLLITEKDNFNKSQKNFLEPQKIKIGER